MSGSDVRIEPEYPRPQGGTDWARIEAMTGEEALRNALADPDNPPLTDEQLSRMRRVPNPQEIRQRLGLTQREFAKLFQIALGTLRDWEQGARRPDSAAKAYLRVIQENPNAVLEALDHSRHTVRYIRYPWDPRHSNSSRIFALAQAVPFDPTGKRYTAVEAPEGVTATSELRLDVKVEKRVA